MTDQPHHPQHPQDSPHPHDEQQPNPTSDPTGPASEPGPYDAASAQLTPPPPPPPNPYGAAPQADPYAVAQANPYGAPMAAPAYAGGPAIHPGSLGYVQQYFGPVASFGQRVLAVLIDSALSLIGLIPVIIGIVVLATAAPSTTTSDEFGNSTLTGGNGGLAAVGALLIGIGALISLAITLWNRVFRMGRTGQSVGKSVIGLKLIDDKTGQPIGAGMCFLREIVHGVVNQVFYLSYLWMLWDTDKQTVGDKAVHSTVIVVPKP
ncbi:MAG: RDD family protein [Ornithinibacter sp.]